MLTSIIKDTPTITKNTPANESPSHDVITARPMQMTPAIFLFGTVFMMRFSICQSRTNEKEFPRKFHYAYTNSCSILLIFAA